MCNNNNQKKEGGGKVEEKVVEQCEYWLFRLEVLKQKQFFSSIF